MAPRRAEFEFDEDHSYFMVRLPIHPAALEVAESQAAPESRLEFRARVGARVGPGSRRSRGQSQGQSARKARVAAVWYFSQR